MPSVNPVWILMSGHTLNEAMRQRFLSLYALYRTFRNSHKDHIRYIQESLKVWPGTYPDFLVSWIINELRCNVRTDTQSIIWHVAISFPISICCVCIYWGRGGVGKSSCCYDAGPFSFYKKKCFEYLMIEYILICFFLCSDIWPRACKIT